MHTLAGVIYLPEPNAPDQATRLTSRRVGVLGTADVAANAYQKSFGNQELMIRLTQFIAGEDVIISAYREVGQNAQFQITAAQRSSLIRQTVVLPTLAALIFVPLVYFRLRRG